MTGLLSALPLAIFAFGAMAFSVLALSYWWQKTPANNTLFRWFTFACAAAFGLNLISSVFLISNPLLDAFRERLVGILPPMMLQLVLPSRFQASGWRWLPLGALYAASLSSDASAWVLGCGAGLALLVSLEAAAADESHHGFWNVAIFAGLLIAAGGSSWIETPLWELLPDYLLLLFFAVWLYYRERLSFFDVFLKRGSYFVCGVLLLVPLSEKWPLLLALWMAGPEVYRLLSRWVDRRMLARRYSSLEAERVFAAAVQGCSDETSLRQAAEASLKEIFKANARVDFQTTLPSSEPAGGYAIAIEPKGGIRLEPRSNRVPYLSDDLRLLEVLASTLSVVRQNLEFQIRQRELAEHANRAELRALRAQINPHFLFNALNAIAGWIRLRPELADDTVAQLAEVFRYALNRSGEEWVSAGEEVEFIRAYLAVEQARFGDRLMIEIVCDDAARPVKMPAMLIQPIVENAMRHGVAPVAGVGEIELRLSQTADRLKVEVNDNGPGFPEDFTPQDGHGLRNVADRLRGYYAANATLRWENTSQGCRVTMEIPITK